MRRLQNKKAFTLIEVLLVVIILGVIAAMVFPRLTGRSKSARIAIAKTDIQGNLPTALDLYELDCGAYPTTDQGLKALIAKPSAEPVPNTWAGPYLRKPPIDPWDSAYQYRNPGRHGGDYDLFSVGPDGKEGGGDDVTNWGSGSGDSN